jgi:ectoine hydroxylase-related dioxygenase (phytanoyl-CoA dioxygenase family)
MKKESSYKIYSNVLSEEKSSFLFKFLIKLIRSYDKNFGKKLNFKGWEDHKFNHELINIRKNNKKLFSAIYDSINESFNFLKVPFENKFIDIASDYLKVPKDNLTITCIQLRMDAPKDKRNVYRWHQDSAYTKLNISSTHGAILWIPLINTNRRNGTLVIKPGSQYSDIYCSERITNKKDLYSEQILVKKNFLNKYKSKHVNVKKNSALATYMGIFHKSGINNSRNIRFTIVVRFANIFKDDFIFRRKLRNINTELSSL